MNVIIKFNLRMIYIHRKVAEGAKNYFWFLNYHLSTDSAYPAQRAVHLMR